ncbi:hypothetical protein MVEN_02610800 [Mycena venus]|uniref:WAP domain-containing protein n=1 Tax=Mycena venus TaxID=2733690 RepID=A0A8H6U148_9AGAR|nr:hypothetical protein MVEN_02610800 [Mycena venus]
MRAQFIIVLSALAAIGAAYPGAKLGRSNSFNGDICNTDSDCPSDYPYCQGAFPIFDPFEPSECIMECSNDNTVDGCLPDCGHGCLPGRAINA